ncbi:MAG: hypothetical protein GX295_03300 [Syntrophomonadaceae bacterium]|nr:hypothetical protein [Syntrophomonadaceae bacterium]
MFDSISKWITENITEPLQEMIVSSVNAVLITFLNNLVDFVTGIMQKEAELAQSLIDSPYIIQAVKYSITLALTLLAVRIAFEAFQTYMAYNTGEQSNPGDLIKKAAGAAVLIVSSPWIVRQVLVFSFSIVDDIQVFQAVPDVSTFGQAVAGFVFTQAGLISAPAIIFFIFAIILWIIVLIQMAVRAVNIAMLMIVGPWMWAFQNELGKSWFKALVGQCFAIPIQIFMLRGALGSFIATSMQGPLSGLLFVGFLWSAIKFPAFLQQLVAQTGVGGAIGGTAQHVGSAVFIRRLARGAR